MSGIRILAIYMVAECLLSTLPAAASQSQRTYLHRSRGADLRAVDMTVAQEADGTVRYTIADFPSGDSGSTVQLVTGLDGKPVEYRNTANGENGFDWRFHFATNAVVLTRKMPNAPVEETSFAIRTGSLPDLNSRPDPCLTPHLLVQAYDYSARGKQVFNVYDIDNTGKGIAEYQVSLELAEDSSVLLPNGRFKARHLVLVQQTSAPTWYKKHRGSQTDIWTSEDGCILRIFRHREPYEIILQNHNKPEDLISASESAQGYPQPACKAP
jgi:hypothetical protein